MAEPVEILLYEPIGETYGGRSAREFADLVKQNKSAPLVLRINSPGGDYHEAVAIYNQLRAHRPGVTVHVDAEAASAASLVAMAGAKILMARGSHLMIHEPWSVVAGPAREMQAAAAWLEKLTESAIDIYAERTGAERDQLAEWLTAETWFTAAEAVDAGFADEMESALAVAALRVDRARFRQTKTPADLLASADRAPSALPRRAPAKSRQDELLDRVAALGPQLADLVGPAWACR